MKSALVTMMKPTSLDFSTGQSNQQNSTEGHPAIRFIGGYLAAVLLSLSLVILLVMLFYSETDQIPGVRLFLTFTFLYVVFYSMATTKTVNTSFGSKWAHITKRFFEVVAAGLGLLGLAPLMVLLAIAVAAESSGPIFYRSRRLGQFGKTFGLYLFRTMRVAPTEQPATKIGRFLRSTGFRNLPAYVNVLVGEMSIVGPAPYSPQELEKILELDPDRQIFTVRPGMVGTGGLVRMLGGSFEDQVRSDMLYVQQWSLLMDVDIIFKIVLYALREEHYETK